MDAAMNIAAYVSYCTEPLLLVIVLILLGGWHAGLRDLPWIYFLVYVGVFSFLVWVLRIVAVKKLKTNWDMSDRKKRVYVLFPLVAISAIFFLLQLMWGNASLLWFSLSLFVWILGFALITLRTKISGHMAVLTLCIGSLVLWYGVQYSPLFLLVPLVAWSRIVLKRHTPIEVIGGVSYSALVLLFLW